MGKTLDRTDNNGNYELKNAGGLRYLNNSSIAVARTLHRRHELRLTVVNRTLIV